MRVGLHLLWDLARFLPQQYTKVSKQAMSSGSAHCRWPRTAEHDTTNPSISIPASARAVLAAMAPAAMHPSIPSFSMIVTKISIVDFGKSSKRTDDSNACWICTPTDLSSASYTVACLSAGPWNLCELNSHEWVLSASCKRRGQI